MSLPWLPVVLAAFLLSSASAQQIEKSTPIYWDFSDRPVPRFRAGLVLAYEISTPTLRAFDQTGSPVITVTLSDRDAPNARVREITATPEGLLVAALTLQGPSTAIAWLNRDGSLRRLLRTTPFVPMQILVAPDGALWVAGRLRDSVSNEVPGHDVLRRYDAEGRLTASLLPRQSLSTAHPHPTEDARLVAGSDRIGFFSQIASEWVEFSLRGELTGRWKTVPFPRQSFIGTALSESGNLYITVFSTSRSPEGQHIAGSALYRLDKSTSAWIPVDFPQLSGLGKAAHLLGSEGRHLVFLRQSPRGLDWVRLP